MGVGILRRLASASLVLCLSVLRADAEIVAHGSEFLLLTDLDPPPRDGVTVELHVAGWPEGAFVLAWSGSETDDEPRSAVLAQLFDERGLASGPVLRVSPKGTSAGTPRVATGADGSFVVAWIEVVDPTARSRRMRARRFGLSGGALDDVIEVSVPEFEPVGAIAVGMAGDGSVVAAWSVSSSAHKLVLGRFGPDGLPAGDPDVVHDSYFSIRSVEIAFNSATEFVIGWVETGYAGGIDSTYEAPLFVRRFNDRGPMGNLIEPAGRSEAEAAASGGGVAQGDRSFGLAGVGPGRWVVANNLDNTGRYIVSDYPHYYDPYPVSLGLRAEVFEIDAGRGSQSITANDGPGFNRGFATAAAPSGNFVVVWGQESTHRHNVVATALNCGGYLEPPVEFRVSEEVGGDQYWPDVAAVGEDEFVITWVRKNDAGDREAVGRRYAFRDTCTTCGDLDGDGRIVASDAFAVLRAAVGILPCHPRQCDVNGDGLPSAFDALSVLRRSVDPTVGLGCGT